MVHIIGDKKNPALVTNLKKCSISLFTAFKQARSKPTPKDSIHIIINPSGTINKFSFGCIFKTYMSGIETSNPNDAITKLDPTLVIANISLGK
jgi:hypothetical protein